MDIAYKNEFARLEAEQEAKAFMSKMEEKVAMIKAAQEQSQKKSVVTNYTSKSELIQVLKTQLTRKDQAVKALLKIYANQTKSEQLSKSVKEYNGVGFTGVDADFLSSLAERVKRGFSLSEKQSSYLVKIMPKYARQLLNQSIQEGKIKKEGKFYVFEK